MLPKTSAYVKIYDGKSFGIYFLIENDDLVKKKNTWNKVSADETAYDKKLSKPK